MAEQNPIPPVLLSHAYFLEDDPKEQAIMKPYPPLGLLYLSAWLDRHGVQNEVYDTTFSTKAHFKVHLLAQKPRILALYVNLMTKINVLEIIRFMRQEESLQQTLIVLGGPDVTHNTADYLTQGADLIVIGEGEQTMLDIALAVDAFQDASAAGRPTFEHIPGLAFLQPDGLVFKTAGREKIRDIDTLPFPNRQKIDLKLYLDAWKKTHGQNAVSVSTQRGCPYTCRWCSTAVYGQSYRRRSPANVAEELSWLQQHYTFDLIWFVDDVFTISHKWLNEFRDALQERRLKIRFECITRADRLNPEVLQVLKEAGCFRVWIGAESGSQRIIDAMDRRVDVEQVRSMIRLARQTGIETGTFIMLGYPGETESDIRETVRHLKASNPDLFTITVAYPIKGTGLYEEVEASSPAELPWDKHSDRDLDFKRTYARPYYGFAVRWTVNSLRLHKLQIAGKTLTINALKTILKIVAARTGMWWNKQKSA